eukprot:355212-Chlamydomonas_euryale.AAC.3
MAEPVQALLEGLYALGCTVFTPGSTYCVFCFACVIWLDLMALFAALPGILKPCAPCLTQVCRSGSRTMQPRLSTPLVWLGVR